MKQDLESAFRNMQQLTREERLELAKNLTLERPNFGKELFPRWWYWKPCEVHVLLVTDGGLSFGLNNVGLSEFIETFRQLEIESNVHIRYKVTLAHRSASPTGTDPMLTANTSIVNRITNFAFAALPGKNTATLTSFDQIWLFGIDSAGSLQPTELTNIEAYMNGGGGLFATGDHGALGKTMGGFIERVKDMRYWDNTSAIDNINEVSMAGARRNDTNRPLPGNTSSTNSNDQSDAYPQNIGVRTFGAGNPHPLLSISAAKRPSRIIDIMPDHPHEGECQPERSFTVNGITVATQIIATSFVPGGNTSGSKAPTIAHCFPSISVWDGHLANAGRIVIDSTWHHFVNMNLEGFGASDFNVIQQYFMNIATWMTRRKNMLCLLKFTIIDLIQKEKIIEASLNNPEIPLTKVPMKDLDSIGMLASTILEDRFNPVFAEQFKLEVAGFINPQLARQLNAWAPGDGKNGSPSTEGVLSGWINYDPVLNITLGAGITAMRGAESKLGEMTEKNVDKLFDVFLEGAIYGMETAVQSLQRSTELAFKNTLNAKNIVRKPKFN